MSKLYLDESGRVIPTLGEELTIDRRARKLLQLPATAADATLYLLARPYPESQVPLRIAINGLELPPVAPSWSGAYLWYAVPVAAGVLRPGENVVELWCDAPAMNAWSLALEAGQVEPRSALSDDGGQSWRREKMGYLNALRAEYVVRMRLTEGEDPPPPRFIAEPASQPRLERLRALIPAEARASGALLGRVRALTGWISTSWEHRHSGRAAQYAPWDAATILAWGQAGVGHNGQVPIVMCVHYAVAFVSCCQAVGIPARCAVLWGSLNGFDGHFVAEVWFPGHGKWVMVDPNLDAIFWREGVPLSITEIQRAGETLGDLVEWGPGIDFQRRNPTMAEWLETHYLNGVCFRHRAIWPRADFLAHPEESPPGHGSTSYCETALVWETRDRERGFGMFPFFAEPAYFDAPPEAEAS